MLHRRTSLRVFTVMTAIAGVLAFTPNQARAQEPTLQDVLMTLGFTNTLELTTETFSAGSYEIHLLAEFAAFHAVNTVSHYATGTSDFEVLITGPEGNLGFTNPQISVLLVQTAAFGLSFETGGNRFFTEVARNPDGVDHARVFADLDDPGTFLIGFEDFLGGGDLDYQDMVFRLNPSEGPSGPLTSLPPLSVTPRIYIDEINTPGLANADRELVLSMVISNPGPDPRSLVLCPMLHAHDPTEPDETGDVLTITASGGQAVTGTYTHARTIRYPFPEPTPKTLPAGQDEIVNYRAKLTDFIPSLAPFTRGEIRSKILDHAATTSTTLYVDYFFEDASSMQFMDPGETFQCPNGPNTWWKFGIEDPDDFDEAYHWMDFTFTNAFSTLTVPITIHTSETAGAILAGNSIDAHIEVELNCTLVDCPDTPDTSGSDGRPAVVWSTDPPPGTAFTIDEIEQVGSLTIDTPDDMPEGAVISFHIVMREVGTDRLLSDESKRFALDTGPPVIVTSSVAVDGNSATVDATMTVQDQAASVAFAQLLMSHDGGATFRERQLDWIAGDFLGPTEFAGNEPLPNIPGNVVLKLRAVDEAGNAADTETVTHSVHAVIEIPPAPDESPVIRMRGQRFVTVALVSTPDFDALTQTDVASLRFGPTGTEAAVFACNARGNDVSRDSIDDLICHFRTRDLGFAAGDSVATMTDQTTTGSPFSGSHPVTILP